MCRQHLELIAALPGPGRREEEPEQPDTDGQTPQGEPGGLGCG